MQDNWQDAYISKRDDYFICWDHEGEFIALAQTQDEARDLLTEYVNKYYKGKNNANSFQQSNGPM